ncbi:MAG TPA: hypothetical protein DDY68_02005 [Porphyromonadaceae bacterium]|nr:hypothetical protein [Porphyromonadaceae bacterium]
MLPEEALEEVYPEGNAVLLFITSSFPTFYEIFYFLVSICHTNTLFMNTEHSLHKNRTYSPFPEIIFYFSIDLILRKWRSYCILKENMIYFQGHYE